MKDGCATTDDSIDATQSAQEASRANLDPALSSEPDHQLDRRLFVVVTLILALLGALYVAGLVVQVQTYRTAINQALSDDKLVAVLVYSRAMDAAIVKTSGLFLGHVLVFTGALFVLRIATTQYRLNLQSGKNSGSLQTSSPGLVIITLGVLLVVMTIINKTTEQYNASFDNPPQTQAPPGDTLRANPTPGLK